MLAAFNTTLRKCRARNYAQKIWMPLTFTCLELYTPNTNIYTGLLDCINLETNFDGHRDFKTEFTYIFWRSPSTLTIIHKGAKQCTLLQYTVTLWSILYTVYIECTPRKLRNKNTLLFWLKGPLCELKQYALTA